jgi:uncharacterized protein YwgA
MSPYDFVHLSLHAMGGEIRGKTKLQKTIYFLGLFSNMVDDLGYRAHYYGPYSADVAGAAQQLRALGFAVQTACGVGSVDSAGFEVARHDLCLTEEGTRMAKAKAAQNPQEWARISNAAKKLQAAKELDYMKLSIAAKTYFMMDRKKQAVPLGDLVPVAQQFGWSVTTEQIQEAAQFLEAVGLVKRGP